MLPDLKEIKDASEANSWVEAHLNYIQHDKEYKEYLELLELHVEALGDDLVYKGTSKFTVDQTKVTPPKYANVDATLAALHKAAIRARAKQQNDALIAIHAQMNALELYKARLNALVAKDHVVELQQTLSTLQASNARASQSKWTEFLAKAKTLSVDYVKYPMTYYVITPPVLGASKAAKPSKAKESPASSPMNAKAVKKPKARSASPSPPLTLKQCTGKTKAEILAMIKESVKMRKRMPTGYDKLKKEDLCKAMGLK